MFSPVAHHKTRENEIDRYTLRIPQNRYGFIFGLGLRFFSDLRSTTTHLGPIRGFELGQAASDWRLIDALKPLSGIGWTRPCVGCLVQALFD